MILHFVQSLRTEERTFIEPSLIAIDDPSSRQVVRRQLHRYLVSRQDADEVLAHLARDVSQHPVLVLQLHSEHGVRQRLDHRCHNLNCLFLGHTEVKFTAGLGRPVRYSSLPPYVRNGPSTRRQQLPLSNGHPTREPHYPLPSPWVQWPAPCLASATVRDRASQSSESGAPRAFRVQCRAPQ